MFSFAIIQTNNNIADEVTSLKVLINYSTIINISGFFYSKWDNYCHIFLLFFLLFISNQYINKSDKKPKRKALKSFVYFKRY